MRKGSFGLLLFLTFVLVPVRAQLTLAVNHTSDEEEGFGYEGDTELYDDDKDRDGYVDEYWGGKDCDDSNPGVNPGAIEEYRRETCFDGVDNDCDGVTDLADSDCGELLRM